MDTIQIPPETDTPENVIDNGNFKNPEFFREVKLNGDAFLSLAQVTSIRQLSLAANINYPIVYDNLSGKVQPTLYTLFRLLHFGAGLPIETIKGITLGQLFDFDPQIQPDKVA